MKWLLIGLTASIALSPSITEGQCFPSNTQQSLDGYYIEVEASEDGSTLLLKNQLGVSTFTKYSPTGELVAENTNLRSQQRMVTWKNMVFPIGNHPSPVLWYKDLTPVTYPFTKCPASDPCYLDTLNVFIPGTVNVSIGADDDYLYILTQQQTVHKYTWADSALIEVDRFDVGTSYQEDMQVVGEEIYSFGVEWIMDEFTGKPKQYNSAYITDKTGNHLRTVRWPRPEAQNSLEVKILEHGVMFIIGWGIEVRSPTGSLLCRESELDMKNYIGSSYRNGILYTISHDSTIDSQLIMFTPGDYGTPVRRTTWGNIKALYKDVTP